MPRQSRVCWNLRVTAGDCGAQPWTGNQTWFDECFHGKLAARPPAECASKVEVREIAADPRPEKVRSLYFLYRIGSPRCMKEHERA
jgi:hypothetical protein